MSKLADLIERRRDELVAGYVRGLRESTAATSLPERDVEDSVREFLGDLAEQLRESDRDDATEVTRSAHAAAHGEQRFGLGYDIGALVREYSALWTVIGEAAGEEGDIAAKELVVLGQHLVAGLADAAGQYTIARDQELQDQSSRYLAFLAHELRNPLMSSRHAFEVLRQRAGLEDDRLATIVDRGQQRVADLIDSALTEVRLRTGGKAASDEVDVRALIEDVADETRVEAELRGQRVEVTSDAEQVMICGEARLIHSVLSNLVRNGLKFSREGGTITVRCRTFDDHVVVEVEDECGGLPPGTVQRLFNPFVQMGQDKSGFGLGLAIAKQAAEAHAGTLRVHDLPPKGCVFVLDLPVARPEEAEGSSSSEE